MRAVCVTVKPQRPAILDCRTNECAAVDASFSSLGTAGAVSTAGAGHSLLLTSDVNLAQGSVKTCHPRTEGLPN
jgi:hypothetical protein